VLKVRPPQRRSNKRQKLRRRQKVKS